MGIWRGLLVAICLLTGGCIPHEGQFIGAVDPLNNIPAIQKAAEEKDERAAPALVDQLSNDVYYLEADEQKPSIERWRSWLKQRKT